MKRLQLIVKDGVSGVHRALKEVVSKGGECLKRELYEMFSKIRRKNGLERVFLEVRIMSCFEKQRSFERIIYALFQYYKRK